MARSYVLLTLIIVFQFIFEETSASVCAGNNLEISLPQGKIKGTYDFHRNQRKFLGIPYASIEARFEGPGKPPSWNNTFNGDRGSIKCKQYHPQWKTAIGQEDCLVLNVFAPASKFHKHYPVMVFLHGGGYYWGSNSEWIYNPRYLVKEKVIVVTINYRLGAFGFLCLGLKGAPGNVGLKDQIAALKWIQNNIAYFGGDPDSVTLFGESAGAFSINYLLLTHSAKGLFHKAILQSGSILTPQAFSYTPIESASKVALSLGYNTSDPNELLKIFENATADDIVEASYIDLTNNALAPYMFRPCMETAITSRRPLITAQPRDLLKNIGLNISVIIGFNDKEGIYWATHYTPINHEKIREISKQIIPDNLSFESEANKTSWIDDVMSLYFVNETAQSGLIDYFTDSLIRYPAMATSETFCRKPNRSVYNYYFTYDSIRNISKLLSRLSTVPGASHADELFYIFDPVIYNLLPPNSKDRVMIRNMVKLWTNFAKTGKPNVSNITWSPCGNALNFLELGRAINMYTLPNTDRIEFWKETYEKYGRK